MVPTRNRGFGSLDYPLASFWRCFFRKYRTYFSRITYTRHKCFEKYLFTIVVATSSEKYFSLHFCWRIIIATQFCRFCNYPRAIFPVVNWRRDLPKLNCPREINMTMKWNYPRPLFTVVKIPAKLEFIFDSRRRQITSVKNELDSAVANSYFVTICYFYGKDDNE